MTVQWWLTQTKAGLAHAFGAHGLTCCGARMIRACVAPVAARKCTRCEEATRRMEAAMRRLQKTKTTTKEG